jgi:hypothetical protein
MVLCKFNRLQVRFDQLKEQFSQTAVIEYMVNVNINKMKLINFLRTFEDEKNKCLVPLTTPLNGFSNGKPEISRLFLGVLNTP